MNNYRKHGDSSYFMERPKKKSYRESNLGQVSSAVPSCIYKIIKLETGKGIIYLKIPY